MMEVASERRLRGFLQPANPFKGEGLLPGTLILDFLPACVSPHW